VVAFTSYDTIPSELSEALLKEAGYTLLPPADIIDKDGKIKQVPLDFSISTVVAPFFLRRLLDMPVGVIWNGFSKRNVDAKLERIWLPDKAKKVWASLGSCFLAVLSCSFLCCSVFP
jgi:hypothetical protein